MTSLNEFMESFRQTGNTTILVETIRRHKAFLIVSSQDVKRCIMKNFSCTDLSDKIWSLPDIEKGKLRGIDIRNHTVFFDNTAISMLLSMIPTIKNSTFASGLTIDTDGGIKLTVSELNEGNYTKQINVKLTEDDVKSMDDINQTFFENEASNSMLGRILLRKGMAFYKKLKMSF